MSGTGFFVDARAGGGGCGGGGQAAVLLAQTVAAAAEARDGSVSGWWRLEWW